MTTEQGTAQMYKSVHSESQSDSAIYCEADDLEAAGL